MTKDSNKDIFTIGIGGAAGDGVREAGQNLGLILTNLGYEVFLSFTYPSLIRGGHNFARISFGKEKIWCDHKNLDVLIALNEETVKIHKDELNPDTVVFADKFEPEMTEVLKEKAVVLPMLEYSQKLKAIPITRNSLALGATCYLLDLSFSALTKVLEKVFKEKSYKINIDLAEAGYKLLEDKKFRHSKTRINTDLKQINTDKIFLDGNTAFGKGLQAAGLDFYIAYPMTPATSILHYLAKEQAGSKLRVIQPEGEIAVMNMALGAAFAGKRVAVGTATGGFALMQETFSFAGMAELPVVINVSQRQAPATGVPTYSSQTDLQFVIHSGHGEFPRIVLLPGDHEEMFAMGAKSLNLAWKFQTPVIVLSDKIIAEHSTTCSIDASKIKIEKGKLAEKMDDNYKRYKITEDGISPMAFPGTPKAIIKVTSYEHNQEGITTEELNEVKAIIDKRFAKNKFILEEMSKNEAVKIYGDPKAENVLVFWGSTKGAVLEAAKYFDKPVKMLQILWAEPFPTDKVIAELSNAKKIIDIECNHNAQMAALIREKTSINITEKILRYDSRPFEPITLAEEINKILA